MSTASSDQTAPDGATPPQRGHRARSVLIWTTGALSLAMLTAALFVFFATLNANGANGTALIIDFYQRLAATCL